MTEAVVPHGRWDRDRSPSFAPASPAPVRAHGSEEWDALFDEAFPINREMRDRWNGEETINISCSDARMLGYSVNVDTSQELRALELNDDINQTLYRLESGQDAEDVLEMSSYAGTLALLSKSDLPPLGTPPSPVTTPLDTVILKPAPSPRITSFETDQLKSDTPTDHETSHEHTPGASFDASGPNSPQPLTPLSRRDSFCPPCIQEAPHEADERGEHSGLDLAIATEPKPDAAPPKPDVVPPTPITPTHPAAALPSISQEIDKADEEYIPKDTEQQPASDVPAAVHISFAGHPREAQGKPVIASTIPETRLEPVSQQTDSNVDKDELVISAKGVTDAEKIETCKDVEVNEDAMELDTGTVVIPLTHKDTQLSLDSDTRISEDKPCIPTVNKYTELSSKTLVSDTLGPNTSTPMITPEGTAKLSLPPSKPLDVESATSGDQASFTSASATSPETPVPPMPATQTTDVPLKMDGSIEADDSPASPALSQLPVVEETDSRKTTEAEESVDAEAPVLTQETVTVVSGRDGDNIPNPPVVSPITAATAEKATSELGIVSEGADSPQASGTPDRDATRMVSVPDMSSVRNASLEPASSGVAKQTVRINTPSPAADSPDPDDEGPSHSTLQERNTDSSANEVPQAAVFLSVEDSQSGPLKSSMANPKNLAALEEPECTLALCAVEIKHAAKMTTPQTPSSQLELLSSVAVAVGPRNREGSVDSFTAIEEIDQSMEVDDPHELSGCFRESDVRDATSSIVNDDRTNTPNSSRPAEQAAPAPPSEQSFTPQVPNASKRRIRGPLSEVMGLIKNTHNLNPMGFDAGPRRSRTNMTPTSAAPSPKLQAFTGPRKSATTKRTKTKKNKAGTAVAEGGPASPAGPTGPAELPTSPVSEPNGNMETTPSVDETVGEALSSAASLTEAAPAEASPAFTSPQPSPTATSPHLSHVQRHSHGKKFTSSTNRESVVFDGPVRTRPSRAASPSASPTPSSKTVSTTIVPPVMAQLALYNDNGPSVMAQLALYNDSDEDQPPTPTTPVPAPVSLPVKPTIQLSPVRRSKRKLSNQDDVGAEVTGSDSHIAKKHAPERVINPQAEELDVLEQNQTYSRPSSSRISELAGFSAQAGSVDRAGGIGNAGFDHKNQAHVTSSPSKRPYSPEEEALISEMFAAVAKPTQAQGIACQKRLVECGFPERTVGAVITKIRDMRKKVEVAAIKKATSELKAQKAAEKRAKKKTIKQAEKAEKVAYVEQK